MSGGEEFGKSLRPMEPAKTRSPESTQPSVRYTTLPGVCPGVWSTSIRNPANVRTSPSDKARTSFTGGNGTPTPEFSAVSGPDSDAIAATLTQYTAYISDENWEGMCSLYSVNILRSLTCDQLAAGIQSTAPGYVPGSIDATINNIRVIELQQDTAKVIYDFCLIMGSQDTCYTTTASMFREEGNWLVGFAL